MALQALINVFWSPSMSPRLISAEARVEPQPAHKLPATSARQHKVCGRTTLGLMLLAGTLSACSATPGTMASQRFSAWLIGSWAICNTGAGFTLRADGTYDEFYGSGRWNLDGDLLTLKLTRLNDVDERPAVTDQTRVRVRRDGPERIVTWSADDPRPEPQPMVRNCPPLG
jgi:hypothetical protein